MFRNELVFDEAAEVYRAAPGLNKSSIDKILDCPAAYKGVQNMQQEPTAAMQRGTVVHMLTLQPELFERTYLVATRPTKVQKEEALAGGKEIITESLYETASAMAESLRKTEPSASLLAMPGASECSVYWSDMTSDGEEFQCKARVDRLATLNNGDEIAIDVKTTSGSCDPLGTDIAKHIAQFHYYRQAAWYLEGLRVLGHRVHGFVFLFVSTTPPFLCSSVVLNERAILLGDKENTIAAKLWLRCEKKNEWPSYSSKIEEVDLPIWAYTKNNIN